MANYILQKGTQKDIWTNGAESCKEGASGKLKYTLGRKWMAVDALLPLLESTLALENLLYWGLYCPQHNVWLHSDKGICYWPSPSIADAVLTSNHLFDLKLNFHLWEVTQYGKQQPLPKDQSQWKETIEICKGVPEW